MKTTFIITFFLFAFNSASAESLYPNEVVRLFIQGIQQNDLQKVIDTADLVRIASQPRHGMNPEQLVKFFKNIDFDKIKFQKREIKSLPKSVTVRMVQPISVDFDLEWQKATYQKQEGYYLIVSVHP